VERVRVRRPDAPAAEPPRPAHGIGRLVDGGPLQLTVAWKGANHTDNALDGFTAALNGEVQTGATLALDTPDALPGTDGYTLLWKDTALIVTGLRDPNGGLDPADPGIITALALSPARYGYAVEQYACAQAGTLGAALPNAYTYQLQASRGMTRPDVVVFDANNAEVGWFDITSDGSLGHIDRKTGSSWQTKPYVAEITYPALNLGQVGTGQLSIGQKVALKNTLKRAQKVWDDLVDRKRTHFLDVWKSYKGAEQGSKKSMRVVADLALGAAFSNHQITQSVAQSILRSFELLPKNYGYDPTGGTKAAGDMIIRAYQDV
jgi:hypothetical protein